MSWQDLSPELRELAERVCTPKQIEALKLKASGYGRRRMSIILSISESAVRDRVLGAQRKLAIAIEKQRQG